MTNFINYFIVSGRSCEDEWYIRERIQDNDSRFLGFVRKNGHAYYSSNNWTARFLFHPDDLRGRRNVQLIYTGTYYVRTDIDEIKEWEKSSKTEKKGFIRPVDE